MLYIFVSTFSFIIRSILCYFTIDKIPIFRNHIANSLFLEVLSLYTLLMIISRSIVGIFYGKGENPVLGSLEYFIVYIIILGIVFVVMTLLTIIGILPF